jgi:hypothetical protein
MLVIIDVTHHCVQCTNRNYNDCSALSINIFSRGREGERERERERESVCVCGVVCWSVSLDVAYAVNSKNDASSVKVLSLATPAALIQPLASHIHVNLGCAVTIISIASHIPLCHCTDELCCQDAIGVEGNILHHPCHCFRAYKAVLDGLEEELAVFDFDQCFEACKDAVQLRLGIGQQLLLRYACQ